VTGEPSPDEAGRRRFGSLSRKPNERWGEFAERVSNAFGLVLLLVITSYVLGSLVSYSGWTAALTTVIVSGAAVVALASSQAHPYLVRTAAALGLVSVVLAAIAAVADDSQILLGASAFVQAALLVVAVGAVLRAVVTESEVGFRTILGAISVYMILGLLFTFLYAALDRVQPGTFFAGGAEAGGGDTIFFSFTTLTTTGYGDLIPAAQPGKMFAGLEMLIGQIFLVTLVAGLVSLWRPRGRTSAARGD